MGTAVTTLRALALLASLAACAGRLRPPRDARVDREELVRTGDPARDRYFATLHGVQSVFAGMDLARARATADLARALGLRPDADRFALSVALARRVAPEDGRPRIGFRARLRVERHRDALDAWVAALGDEAALPRAEEALRASARVRVRRDRCEELSRSLREAVALALLSLAHAEMAQALASVSASLAATADAQSREAPAALRDEYVAAARWLRSAAVRAALQHEAAEQTVLWLRGVLSPDDEEEASSQETGCALP